MSNDNFLKLLQSTLFAYVYKKSEKVILFIPKRVIIAKYDDGLPDWELSMLCFSLLYAFKSFRSKEIGGYLSHVDMYIFVLFIRVNNCCFSTTTTNQLLAQLCLIILKQNGLLCQSAFLNQKNLKDILLQSNDWSYFLIAREAIKFQQSSSEEEKSMRYNFHINIKFLLDV